MGYYDRYKGSKRNRQRKTLLLLSFTLLAVMILAVGFLVLGDFITYSADGIELEWLDKLFGDKKPTPDTPNDPDTDGPDYIIDGSGSTKPGDNEVLTIIDDYLQPVENFSSARTHAPEFVMLHFSSAVVLSKDDPYNMETIRSIYTDYKVSAHYVIDREGKIYCFIPEDRLAWHAGTGTWKDDAKYKNKMNDYAIGIEMLAIGSKSDMTQYLSSSAYDKIDPSLIGYTDAQYASLKLLVEDICQRNSIPMTREHVIGHQDYSSKKSDPGELFDWSRLFA